MATRQRNPSFLSQSSINGQHGEGKYVGVLYPSRPPDLKEHRCSFSQNLFVGDFTFEGAEGAIGLDVLSSFKAATFDFQKSVFLLPDR